VHLKASPTSLPTSPYMTVSQTSHSCKTNTSVVKVIPLPNSKIQNQGNINITFIEEEVTIPNTKRPGQNGEYEDEEMGLTQLRSTTLMSEHCTIFLNSN